MNRVIVVAKSKSNINRYRSLDKGLQKLILAGDRVKLISKVAEINTKVDDLRVRIMSLVGEIGRNKIIYGVKTEMRSLASEFAVKSNMPSKSHVNKLRKKGLNLEKKMKRVKKQVVRLSNIRAQLLEAVSEILPKGKLDIIKELKMANSSLDKVGSDGENLSLKGFKLRAELARVRMSTRVEKTVEAAKKRDDVLGKLGMLSLELAKSKKGMDEALIYREKLMANL